MVLSCSCLVAKVCSTLFATPWTVAHQAPLFMKFPRQEYWSWLPFPSPRDLPKPGIEPASPALAGRFFTTESAGKPVVLSTLDILFHLMLWRLLWGKFYYYTHSTNEETKSASERWGSCLRSHSKWVVMSGVPELVKVKDLNSRSRILEFRSVTQSCLTLCDLKDCLTSSLPVHH